MYRISGIISEIFIDFLQEVVRSMYIGDVEVDAKKLRALRNQRVLTLRELAEEAGVSKDTVSRIEREGTAYPATIRKLAAALDVDPQTLVPGEE